MIDGMTRERIDGLLLYRWAILAPWKSRINVGLSTRIGGVSLDTRKSLNVALHVGDDSQSVMENRRRLTGALGINVESWTSGEQVHGGGIGLIEDDIVGAGSGADRPPVPGVDGLIIRTAGPLGAVLLADCLPVVLYDPRRGVGALCHSGWRGTAQGIAVNAAKRLAAEGTRPWDLMAAVGPGIGPCCYAVGKEVADRLPTAVVSSGNGYWADLETAIVEQLQSCGLSKENIGRAGFCTACRGEEFFSYRKSGGETGRHAAFFAIRATSSSRTVF